MDYNAIDTTIAKAFNKFERIGLGQYDDSTVGITVDGFVMWLIPEVMFIFDKTKLLRKGDTLNVKSLVKTDGYFDAKKSDSLLIHDKKTLATIEGAGVEVWVDVKLLKTFDKSATFKIKSPISPVLVYECNQLVGFIMPIRQPKTEG